MKVVHMFSKPFLLLLSLVILLGVSLESPRNVRASTTKVDVTISKGSLTFGEPPSTATFNQITLSGELQTVKGSLTPLTVIDARGTGEGWSVSVAGTPFTDGEKTLDVGSLKIYKPTGFSSAFTEENKPESVFTESEDPRVLNTESFEIVKADAGNGLGTWTISFEEMSALELTLNPATTRAGNYTSTITWTLIPEM